MLTLEQLAEGRRLLGEYERLCKIAPKGTWGDRLDANDANAKLEEWLGNYAEDLLNAAEYMLTRRIDRHTIRWQDFAHRRLSEISGYEENWDEEGAQKPDPVSIEATRALVDSLPDKYDVPFVAAMPNGSIQLEWLVYGREVNLGLESPGVVTYMKWDFEDEEDDMEGGTVAATELDRITALIDWAYEHTEDPI